MINKIYIYQISDDHINEEKFTQSLSQNILNRVNKYQVDNDRMNSLIGWYILSLKLKTDYSIDLNHKEIKENIYHKPYIDDINFNISHSNKIIVVMISKDYCGIDVEMVNSKFDHSLLSKKILSDDEYQEYISSENQLEYIIMKWTQKEASFKQNGTGIIMSNLNNIDINNINTFNISDNYQNKYYISYTKCDNIEIEFIKECL